MSDRIEQVNGVRWITPDWPAPPTVHAASTLRSGGVSGTPYCALNLGGHVGDDAAAVAANRKKLQQALALPATPLWLTQVHGIDCVDATNHIAAIEADASFTTQTGVVSAVLTADCLPILLCDKNGGAVAAIHAGWRGLAAGVIESTITAMGEGRQLMAWLGPAIGAQRFEVGAEVRVAFLKHGGSAEAAFIPARAGHWWADLYQLARIVLIKQGVSEVYGGQWCTASSREHFYSYRRDGVTGRMATLIWMDA